MEQFSFIPYYPLWCDWKHHTHLDHDHKTKNLFFTELKFIVQECLWPADFQWRPLTPAINITDNKHNSSGHSFEMINVLRVWFSETNKTGDWRMREEAWRAQIADVPNRLKLSKKQLPARCPGTGACWKRGKCKCRQIHQDCFLHKSWLKPHYIHNFVQCVFFFWNPVASSSRLAWLQKAKLILWCKYFSLTSFS